MLSSTKASPCSFIYIVWVALRFDLNSNEYFNIFEKICLLAFLLRVLWANWYHSHVFFDSFRFTPHSAIYHTAVRICTIQVCDICTPVLCACIWAFDPNLRRFGSTLSMPEIDIVEIKMCSKAVTGCVRFCMTTSAVRQIIYRFSSGLQKLVRCRLFTWWVSCCFCLAFHKRY